MRRLKSCSKLCLVVVGILLGGLGTGCTVYKPQGHFEVSKIKAEYESKNFAVTKLGVQGTASTGFILALPLGSVMIGILVDNSNVQEQAMRDLVNQANLRGKSAFLHNVNAEWTNVGVPLIYLEHRLTITADVVEFDKEYVDYKARN